MSSRPQAARLLLSATLGLIAGLALWWFGSPVYNRPIVSAGRPFVALLHGGAVTIDAQERDLLVTRPAAPERIRKARIPVADLTINVILLTTLFAINGQPFSRRNVIGFGLAALVLAAFHVPAFIAKTEAFYAMQPGEWSDAAYPGFRTDLWIGLAHFYQLVAMYAIAVIAWWLLRPGMATPVASAARGSQRTKAKNSRRKR